MNDVFFNPRSTRAAYLEVASLFAANIWQHCSAFSVGSAISSVQDDLKHKRPALVGRFGVQKNLRWADDKAWLADERDGRDLQSREDSLRPASLCTSEELTVGRVAGKRRDVATSADHKAMRGGLVARRRYVHNQEINTHVAGGPSIKSTNSENLLSFALCS
jgi:hypothetical protein